MFPKAAHSGERLRRIGSTSATSLAAKGKEVHDEKAHAVDDHAEPTGRPVILDEPLDQVEKTAQKPGEECCAPSRVFPEKPQIEAHAREYGGLQGSAASRSPWTHLVLTRDLGRSVVMCPTAAHLGSPPQAGEKPSPSHAPLGGQCYGHWAGGTLKVPSRSSPQAKRLSASSSRRRS